METKTTDLLKDEFGVKEYNPDLYKFDNVATGIPSLDDLTDDHVQYYRDNGFLAVQKVFTTEEVQQAIQAMYDIIESQHPAVKIIYERSISDVTTLSSEQRHASVRKLHNQLDSGDPRLFKFAEHPKLQDAIAKLIGSDIERYSDQALLKPPGIGREKPWHQDNAFFDVPLGTPIVGCWIALDNAIPENGCMHIKPGTHNEGPVIHFKRRDFQICDTDVDLTRDVMVPLQPGGILFFDGLLHHGTPANNSSLNRRAMQIHHVPKGTPRTSDEERMAIFGEEGKNATC